MFLTVKVEGQGELGGEVGLGDEPPGLACPLSPHGLHFEACRTNLVHHDRCLAVKPGQYPGRI